MQITQIEQTLRQYVMHWVAMETLTMSDIFRGFIAIFRQKLEFVYFGRLIEKLFHPVSQRVKAKFFLDDHWIAWYIIWEHFTVYLFVGMWSGDGVLQMKNNFFSLVFALSDSFVRLSSPGNMLCVCVSEEASASVNAFVTSELCEKPNSLVFGDCFSRKHGFYGCFFCFWLRISLLDT